MLLLQELEIFLDGEGDLVLCSVETSTCHTEIKKPYQLK